MLPKDNFDLTHWYVQLPINANGVLDTNQPDCSSISTADLNGINGGILYTNPSSSSYNNGQDTKYFYTGPDGAMTLWAPVTGALTSTSGHPRCELRELLNPNNSSISWTAYGTHLLAATCVVSNVPPLAKKVCIGQIHEPSTTADIPMAMIMFWYNGNNYVVYADVWTNGNDNASSSAYQFGTSGIGVPISYQIAVTNGVLSLTINNTNLTWDLFKNGLNWQSNTVYFKAGDYEQGLAVNEGTNNNIGGRVAYYALTHSHAPSITNEPAGQTVLGGNNTTFIVGSVDWTNMTYQWWFNVTNSLTKATNSSFTVTNVSTTNAGNYTVVVSDGFGSVTSSVATLTGQFPPIITNLTANQGVVIGNPATFTVGASGTSPLAYQWWFNTTNKLNATNSTLIINNAQITNAGNYAVAVTNAYGSVTSSVVTLTIIDYVTSTNLFLDAQWLDGIRTNTSLPAESAWFAATNPASLTAATNVLMGSPDNIATMNWWTYFTTNGSNPVRLNVADTLRVTLAFTVQDVNASNTSSGLRFGLYNSANGIRTVNDRVFPSGTNYLGFLLNVNFGQIFDASTTMQFLEHTNLSSPSLIQTTTDYSNNKISSLSAPLKGTPGFSNGVPYTLQFLVHRNTNSEDLSANFTNNAGWNVALTGAWTDTNYLTTAFDTFVIRVATNGYTATNFTFTEFKVELVATNNHPPVPGSYTTNTSENKLLTIPIANLLAIASDPDGDTINFTAVNPVGSNNGSLSLAGGNILYQPATNYYGSDSLSYTLTDYRGASSIGNVAVTVTGPPVFTNLAMSANTQSFTLTGNGVADQTNILWMTTNLAPSATWKPVATNKTGVNGVFNFTDAQITNVAQRFYRLTTP